MKTITIGNRIIGEGHPPYIIAEVSANHNGRIEQAIDTMRMAKEAGADAVKIQSYTPDTMTLNSQRADFMINEGPWAGYNLYQLYEEAHTPFEWHQALFQAAEEIGITLFSTPFDETAVELLESLKAPAYKVASFELTDLPLLRRIGETKKPVILSTGMGNQQEIDEAIEMLSASGATEIVVLHCISSYPAPIEQANILTLEAMKVAWPDVLLGLSDHTISNEAAIVAVARGASIIEKHVTLSRSLGGPDSGFSLEPNELRALVDSCRLAHQALGSASFDLKDAENQNLRFRRSLYVSRPIPKGEKLSSENIRRVRPGFGLAPKHYAEVMGRTASRDLEYGEALSWEMLDDD